MAKLIKTNSGNWVFVTEDEYAEAIKRKKVVRKGKVIKKKVSTKQGYRIDPKTGREVRMSPEEIRKRKKAAKKTAIKRKGKKSQIGRERKKSERVRKSRIK